MTTHARPLADRLALADDAQLERLLRIRGVRADVDWSDFFDAAEALLEPASIQRGLAALTRDEARSLQDAVAGIRPADAALRALALADAHGQVPPPVAALVDTMPAVPDATATAFLPAGPEAQARAAERAFMTVGALADLLLAARRAPLALVATGALSASERRRLADRDGDLDALRALAEMARLALPIDRQLRVTPAAEDWLSASFGPRWMQLAEAFRAALPDGIRADDGWIAVEDWTAAHPWDPTWPQRAARLRDLAERLGLVAADGREPSWAAVLRTGGSADSAPLQALLPTEVDRLFLQNDLTAIAPGPLVPALDNRLRAMTEHESSRQASSYRFTADTIAAALASGETGDGILEFLRTVSLTGVPQPLEYLVMQTAARHGLVRVAADAAGGTIVSSSDATLLEAIEVDRNLRPLGLVRDGDHLSSRVRAESVAWALTDARYPATLVDSEGAGVVASRPFPPAEPDVPAIPYGPLIARLRAAQGPDADAAWLDRELDAAVRAKATLLVEVSMPDGSTRQLTLEASGLGGGRLRGRDRAADLERTLPVRSIRAVTVLDA